MEEPEKGKQDVTHKSLAERLSLCKQENYRLKDLVVQLSEIVLKNLCKKEK